MFPVRRTASRVLAGRKVPHRGLVMVLGAGLSLALLGWMAAGHLEEVRGVGERVEWRWVWASVACAAASYAMVGMALGELLRMLGFALSWAEVLGIALVSTTANYFVSSAGVSGFALKAHLLRKRRVPYGATVTASVLSSAILYMVLAALIVQGFGYLMIGLGGGARIALMESAFGVLALLGIAVPLLVFFLDKGFRGRVTQKLFHLANRVTFLFSRSEIPREQFDAFERQLSEGMDRIHGDKARLTLTVLYTCADWALCMCALYCAFLAVGVRLPVGHLSAGFTVGMASTLIPVLPGGLGVLEGSMSAVFQTLGLAWEKAFVAVLLYRLAYYLIPGLASVLVFWGLKISEPTVLHDSQPLA